tara:strand:+ start:1185 stop:2120 length:936 start_codon:yes stop_codon:yes gene_type:complete
MPIQQVHKSSILPIESIQERDIDLLLLEELSCNFAFADWLTQEAGLPKLKVINRAWKSISEFGLGETDILFDYSSEHKRVYLLIENKIDANFQNEQYARYLQRATEYVNHKNCDEAYCLLVAPQTYCENQNDFDSYMSYESIAVRLEQEANSRSIFKSQLLSIGSEKLRRGYQPVNSLPVQSFWQAYWAFQQKHYPQLIMKKPGIVPQNSDWPTLYDPKLEKVIFYHKLKSGNCDASFSGFSAYVAQKLQSTLPEWAQFVQHGKSFSLRINGPKINRSLDFASQIESVKQGLGDIMKLRDWLLENRNYISD